MASGQGSPLVYPESNLCISVHPALLKCRFVRRSLWVFNQRHGEVC